MTRLEFGMTYCFAFCLKSGIQLVHMKKFILVLLATYYLLHTTILAVHAQTPAFQSTSVSATVIQYNLNITGIIAPFASVVLTSNGVFIQSAVADQTGSFSIKNAPITSGLTELCFVAVDVKRIGESTTCITIPPVQGNVTLNNIFLPPTLGLYQSEITAGATAILFGYSVPNARVVVSLSDTLVYSATADKTGYYEIKVPAVKAGSYFLTATAFSNGRSSLVPTKKIKLTAVTVVAQVEKTAKNVVTNTTTSADNLAKMLLSFLSIEWWIALALLAIIFFFIFLLWKRRKKKKETISKPPVMLANPPLNESKTSVSKFVRKE